MCGIAGIIDPSGRHALGPVTDKMLGLIAHRGPDDHHTWEDAAAGVSLGQRRLAILDLSLAGRQPMCNEDGTIWVTFNGEIYNYLELAEDLRSRGHVFRSKCDTEVILHAYEEWGEECLQRFNGMWAFALWDGPRKKLFCARDRFGVKPFYYSTRAGRFVFASEIKAFRAVPDLALEPDLEIVHTFLRVAIFDHGERTFFEGVQQLLPSHYLVLQDGRLLVVKYWDLEADPAALAEPSDADLCERVRDLLADAVRLRLRSDVPVGTSLSGGLDSSSVVAIAAKRLGVKPRSFSSLYREAAFDERAFVEAMVRDLDLESHIVSPTPDRFLEKVEKITWHQDEPSAGAGVYSQWHVMELAHSQGVKVLLDGQGGDELFAGYPHHFGAYLRSIWLDRRVPLPARAAQLALAARTGSARGTAYNVARALAPAGWRAAYSRRVDPTPEFLDPAFDQGYPAPNVDRTATWGYRADPLNEALHADLRWRLLPSFLHYEDRNSMAWGIEARIPFLDYRLVQFAFNIDYRSKMRGGAFKHLLREAMRPLLPAMVADRKDKKGYPTPFETWVRGPLAPVIREVLTDPATLGRGILARGGVERWLDDHVSGRANRHWHLWSWLTLELWFRQLRDPVAR